MCSLQRNYDVIRNWERFETGPLTVHKVVLLTTKENAAVLAVMILLGPTSSELTFSAFDISGSIAEIIRIKNLNLVLLSIFTTSMPHDAHTINTYGEMISGWQDSFMLKLALQPVGVTSPFSRESVADKSKTS